MQRFFWIVFVPITAWWIIDRFDGNKWPRDWFQTHMPFKLSIIGEDKYGGDFYPAAWQLKDGPFWVKFYDGCARASGRFTILSLNGLMYIFMHNLHFWFMECGWLSRLVDFTDETARLRIHTILGWSTVVSTLVHIWSILFPCVFHGYGVKVRIGV